MKVENNSDDDFEEEELLVYLDFQSKIKSETLDKKNVKIKMIGFDTDEPIVQVNNKMFRGEMLVNLTTHSPCLCRNLSIRLTGVFEHAMGTNVFFSVDPDPPPMDPNFQTVPATMYEYHSQTDKVIKMERIFITPKQDNELDEESVEPQSDEDVVPNESYSDALNQFLKPGELPPRTLSGSDVIKPVEFQSFFRPQLDELVDGEGRSKEVIDPIVVDDNKEMAESDLIEENDVIEATNPVKIETNEQENV